MSDPASTNVRRTHSPRVKLLDWDSNFFGIQIASLDLDGASDDDIRAAEAEARAAGVQCLYSSLDPADAEATVRVQMLGYRLVDVATTSELSLREPPIPRPEEITVRQGTVDDLETLQPMIDKLAGWSRFAVDPRFGRQAAQRLQTAHLCRAASAEDDKHSLILAEGASGPLAFVTRSHQPKPRVDGVVSTTRGAKAGAYLFEDARAWAKPANLLGGPIAARNVRALRFISQCGYRVRWVRYVYHRWLDEDGTQP